MSTKEGFLARDVVRTSNERLKLMAVIEGQEERKAEASRTRFDSPWLLSILLVVLAVMVWRGIQPVVRVEAPPSTLELAEVHEVNDNGRFVEGVCRNKTGRAVAKAVFQVFCGRACEYVVLSDLKPGENRPFRVGMIASRDSRDDGKVVSVPYSIEWK